MVIEIEHHGDRPARGVLKLIDVPGVEGALAIARQVHLEILKARKEASIEVLFQRIKGAEGRRKGRTETLPFHPKNFIAANVRALDPARAAADDGLPVGLGLSGKGQGGGGREEAWNDGPAVVDEPIADGLEVIKA